MPTSGLFHVDFRLGMHVTIVTVRKIEKYTLWMPYIYKFQMFTRLQKPTFYIEKTKNSTRIHVLIAVYSLLVCHYKCFEIWSHYFIENLKSTLYIPKFCGYFKIMITLHVFILRLLKLNLLSKFSMLLQNNFKKNCMQIAHTSA